MRVLVTGAKGFVGRNLCESLKNIRDGKDCRTVYQQLLPLEVYECDVDTASQQFSVWCAQADFVVHLAGVNRPADGDFSGNQGAHFPVKITILLKQSKLCGIMAPAQVPRCLSTAFPTFTASGVGPTTTVPWPHSATPSPTQGPIL